MITSCGGRIIQDNGSHFAIELPNTYKILTPTLPTYTLTYIDVPCEIVGGSFRPHSGDSQWCRSAHILCKEAFINAGLTPERIALAQQIIQLDPKLAAAVKMQTTQKCAMP